MTFITAISKEVKFMSDIAKQIQQPKESWLDKLARSLGLASRQDVAMHPFRVIVDKEISDLVRSWRFKILIGIIVLTCVGSLYTALTNIGHAVKPGDPGNAFFFLKLFTISDGTLPSFFVFISFLGPLLGISLGFDAINSEQNKGTLSRVMAQPIHRDYLINAKFMASITAVSYTHLTLPTIYSV